MFRNTCTFLLSLVLLSGLAAGQVTVEKQKSLIGITKPVIVGDRIFVGADSNPSVVDVAVIHVDADWKWSLLKCRRDGVRVPVEKVDEITYLVVGKGKYLLDATLFDADRGIWNEEFAFELGGVDPPRPPPDPGPDIDPQPDPEPDVPAPIPVAGFRVLMIYETADKSRMPRGQQDILNSKELRAYLDSNCVKGSDGYTPEWRLYDQDIQFPTTCDTVWCKAMTRPRSSIPWVIISNGTTGYEGPWPANVTEFIALLEKYKVR